MGSGYRWQSLLHLPWWFAGPWLDSWTVPGSPDKHPPGIHKHNDSDSERRNTQSAGLLLVLEWNPEVQLTAS